MYKEFFCLVEWFLFLFKVLENINVYNEDETGE